MIPPSVPTSTGPGGVVIRRPEMAIERAPLKVAPRTVRMRPGQPFGWDTALIRRRGPDTSDGFWAIYAIAGVVAVRVIEDVRAPERTAREFWDVLHDAVEPDRRSAEEKRNDAQDAYLTALTIAAEIPP